MATSSSTAVSAAASIETVETLRRAARATRMFVAHKLLDVFIHGWDIAHATGQPATLDPELAQTVYDLFDPQETLLQASGVFGTPVPLAADSDVKTLLLAMLGRDNRA